LTLVVDLIGAVDVSQDALAIHDEQRPAATIPAVVDNVIRARHSQNFIADVRELEPAERFAEPAVRVDIVITDCDDLGVERLKLRVVRPKGG
jgi:hypothetical protein